MTTNVIDRRRKIVATDSRWSSYLDAATIAYVDDTGFDKLANRFGAVLVLAGDGLLIEQWKIWFSEPVLNLAALPATERLQGADVKSVFLSLLEKPTCRLVFGSGWALSHEDEATFVGSGAVFARDCFSANKCSKTAVETAALHDPATGGETKFIELELERHNLLQPAATLSDAEALLRKRGIVMDITTGKKVPFADYVSGAASAALTAGKPIILSAPTGHNARVWTDAEKTSLTAALRAVADAEASRK